MDSTCTVLCLFKYLILELGGTLRLWEGLLVFLMELLYFWLFCTQLKT